MADYQSVSQSESYSVANTISLKFSRLDEHLEDTLMPTSCMGRTLTKRETEILQLIVSGKTNKEIAHTLCRTKRTVEYHRYRLMRKLEAHNAADLVKRAIAAGVLLS